VHVAVGTGEAVITLDQKNEGFCYFGNNDRTANGTLATG
jgi:hypothetical protein